MTFPRITMRHNVEDDAARASLIDKSAAMTRLASHTPRGDTSPSPYDDGLISSLRHSDGHKMERACRRAIVIPMPL